VRNAYCILVRKHVGKIPLGRLRCCSKDNIGMELKRKEMDVVD
jgi:hypothetical protein